MLLFILQLQLFPNKTLKERMWKKVRKQKWEQMDAFMIVVTGRAQGAPEPEVWPPKSGHGPRALPVATLRGASGLLGEQVLWKAPRAVLPRVVLQGMWLLHL